MAMYFPIQEHLDRASMFLLLATTLDWPQPPHPTMLRNRYTVMETRHQYGQRGDMNGHADLQQ